MKQWRKLTGGGIPKGKQHPPNELQGFPGKSTSEIEEETAEPEDDSIEDEFRRGMKVI